jgi:hypothetical protein
MNAHTYFEERLPFYAAGQLRGGERAEIDAHLAGCAECQADLKLWQAVSHTLGSADQAVVAPRGLADQALARVHSPAGLAQVGLRAWQLLWAQALLIQRELWPASAAVMAMGLAVALLSQRAEFIYFLAPLVAASSLAMLYGPEYDPAQELSLSTPTSAWKILLARLSIVSAYNLLLASAATLGLLFFVPPGLLGTLILGWLGPLAFLSALALLLSLWLGTSRAVAIAYGLWFLQYVPFKAVGLWMNSPIWASLLAAYQQFWRSSLLLLPLSLLLIGLALWSARRPVFRLRGALG